jgi:hypothetical protein
MDELSHVMQDRSQPELFLRLLCELLKLRDTTEMDFRLHYSGLARPMIVEIYPSKDRRGLTVASFWLGHKGEQEKWSSVIYKVAGLRNTHRQ